MSNRNAIRFAGGLSLAAVSLYLLIKNRQWVAYQYNDLLDKAALAIVGRRINEIIIHCTATKAGTPCTVEQIDRWHRQRGFDGIGYHYVIYADGSVHEGRPLAKAGAHCVGHNSNSVGIAYVGGLDKNGQPADTRTAAQRQAMRKLVDELCRAYSIARGIHGHREYANKACPCFDVGGGSGL